MSKKLNVKIYKYVHDLVYAGVDDNIAKEYGEYLLKLAQLTEKIDLLSVTDEDGNLPKLTNDQIRNMQDEYSNLIMAGTDFLKDAREDSHKKSISYVIKEINKTLTSELVELSKVKSTDKTDINEISSNAGNIQIDISGSNITHEGGNQSARMPVTYTDANGNKVSGYFTENTVFDSKKELDNLMDKCADGNARYKEVFKAVLKNSYIRNRMEKMGYSEYYSLKVYNLRARGSLDRLFKLELDKISTSKKDYKDLYDDKEFNIHMMEFTKGLSGVFLKKNVLKYNAGVTEGSVLEERNAAMTAMADLLGVHDLLARSVKMTVKNGDRLMQGVFMEKAVGIDKLKTKKGDLLSQIANYEKGEAKISGHFKKQLADLQVLDYICGNVDRHKANMMYIPKKDANGAVYLDGIQGIDNDCAFGVLSADECINGTNRMKGLKDLDYLSDTMQERVMMLTDDIIKTTLRPFNLKPEQIKACINRVKMLQEEIQRHTEYNKFKVLYDEEWENLEVDSKEENYLGFVIGRIEKSIGEDLILNETDEFNNNKLASIDKRLVPQGTSVEARIDNNIEERKLESDERKATSFKAIDSQLKASKKGVWNGSQAFDDIEKAYNAIKKIDKELAKNISIKQMNKLVSEYDKLVKVIDTYLDKKEKEKIDLLKKGDAPSKRATKRTEFASDLKDYANERIESLKLHVTKRNKYIDDIKQSVNGKINAAEKHLRNLDNDINVINIDSMKTYLEATIVANRTILDSIEEHKEQLTGDKLSQMVSVAYQDKLIEETENMISEAGNSRPLEAKGGAVKDKNVRII